MNSTDLTEGAARIHDMGDLVDLQLRRTRRAQALRTEPVYYFDVTCPMSYLAAERVERSLGQIDWIAIDGSALRGPEFRLIDAELTRTGAELQARALGLPLIWPEPFSDGGTRARRAASFACELGAGAAFALAAGRLAYCGGFDLDDPETLAEAAAAAGVPLTPCLEAAGEAWRDDELRELGRMLWSQGVSETPVISVGDRWFWGVAGLMAAGTDLLEAVSAQRPLAPAG
jgi:2-hydroxychromene-2-carboxylate isomerase